MPAAPVSSASTFHVRYLLEGVAHAHALVQPLKQAPGRGAVTAPAAPATSSPVHGICGGPMGCAWGWKGPCGPHLGAWPRGWPAKPWLVEGCVSWGLVGFLGTEWCRSWYGLARRLTYRTTKARPPCSIVMKTAASSRSPTIMQQDAAATAAGAVPQGRDKR